eukprot:14434541-Ditylum_brightwellii.AAC.1
MKLSEARNQAPALQFHVPDSRFEDIEETLLKHDDEIQMMVNKVSIYSQKRAILQAPIQPFRTTTI